MNALPIGKVFIALLCASALATMSRFEARAHESVTTIPAALVQAIGKESDVSSCSKAANQSASAYVRKWFHVDHVRLSRGEPVYYATGGGPCIAGNANLALDAYVAPFGIYQNVLSTFAIRWTFHPDGSAVIDGHDTASVSSRSHYRFDGTSYRKIDDEIVYEPTGEVKAATRPVTFAPGSSSATLSGKVRQDYRDGYAVVASAGQTMSVVTHRVTGTLGDVTVVFVGDGAYRQLPTVASTSWHGKLPSTGRYAIFVDGGNADPAAYSITISIR